MKIYEKKSENFLNENTRKKNNFLGFKEKNHERRESSIELQNKKIDDFEDKMEYYRRLSTPSPLRNKPLYPLTCRDPQNDENSPIEKFQNEPTVTPNRSYFGYQTSHLVQK